MDITPEIKQRIDLLADKYQASGQELLAYLDGLLYADYNTYWDYVHLDTLLSLQTPKTSIPDEEVFIMYHQITELYFKLTLHEIKQVAFCEDLSVELFANKMLRMNRYFGALTHSFGVMEKGMDRQQFLNFRMSLIPASGFQSAQYRMIEIGATDFINLVNKDHREELRSKYADVEGMYQHIYWKEGATLEETGAKTLTLKQFEKKYTSKLLRMAHKYAEHNLWRRFKSLSDADQKNEELIASFKLFDQNVNVNWPLQHYKTAVRYLAKRPDDIASTGGTNWQRYLPPRFQKRIFYPELYTHEEIDNWGRGWVEEALSESQTDN